MCISGFGRSNLTYLSEIIEGRPKVILKVLYCYQPDDNSQFDHSLLTGPEVYSHTTPAYVSRHPGWKTQSSFEVSVSQAV